MKWENTLMAYEEDIKSKSFCDWIKAHTSFMKPFIDMMEFVANPIIYKVLATLMTVKRRYVTDGAMLLLWGNKQ